MGYELLLNIFVVGDKCIPNGRTNTHVGGGGLLENSKVFFIMFLLYTIMSQLQLYLARTMVIGHHNALIMYYYIYMRL